MNALVTGGSGFIGSHIVDKLVEAGHKVRVLDIKAPDRDDVEFEHGDITSQEDVKKALIDIEVVYHVAAFSNINLVKNSPVKTIESNIMGTAMLLEGSRKMNIKRFIFASSVFVHDKKGHLYTTSKLASEMLCENYSTLYSLPYTILRFGTAYGPRSREADAISVFIARALKGEDITIHGSGNQERNYIYVEDMAQGSVAALADIAKDKTYVIAGLEKTSINDIADAVNSIYDNKLTIKRDIAREREDDYDGSIGEMETTMLELDWVPKTALIDGMVKYRDWLQNR